MSERLLSHLKANPFVLAPMAGITDHGFRSFMKSLGASIVITELVSATGIRYRSDRTIKLTSFDETQRPIGVQIFGEDPVEMAEAARFIEGLGADFVDVNFGCPVPKVVKKGAGSAMLRDLPLMARVLGAMVDAVKIPVTIKIRTGWDQNSRNATDVTALAAQEGIAWVAIHGRTRAQAYTGEADWAYMGEVKAASQLPILGNGDIQSAEQALERLQTSRVDGVMIGRGALKNPYIFRESLALLSSARASKEEKNRSKRDYASIFTNLKESIAPHCEERLLQIQLKKFAAWFATGYPGAAQFRRNLFRVQSSTEVSDLAHEFFSHLSATQQADTSQEAFLMGGHG